MEVTLQSAPAVDEAWCKEKAEDGRILIFLITPRPDNEGGGVKLIVKDREGEPQAGGG